MGTHHKSMIRQALDRLDERLAIGESRREAKQECRAAGEHIWAFSTGKIHSYKTRTTYQEHILRFVNWSRDTYQMKTLEQLDTHANELASIYLQQEMDAHKSPYTLQVERSAFRLFFADRTLASSVTLPRRTRTAITRSRGPVAHDRHFQPAKRLATLVRGDLVSTLSFPLASFSSCLSLQGMGWAVLEHYPFMNLLAKRANDKNTPKTPCGPYGS